MENFRKIELLINQINVDIQKAKQGCSGKTSEDIKFVVYKFESIQRITKDLVHRLT